MNGLFKQLLALVLAILTSLNLMFPVMAWAEGEEIPIADPEASIQLEENIDLENGDIIRFNNSLKEVISEDKSERTQYSKEFLMSDGSRLLVMYPETVHYESNGEWKDIDNTLKASRDGNAYINTAGLWDVMLPASYTAGNSSIIIAKNDSSLSFNTRIGIGSDHELMEEEPVVETEEEPAVNVETEDIVLPIPDPEPEVTDITQEAEEPTAIQIETTPNTSAPDATESLEGNTQDELLEVVEENASDDAEQTTQENEELAAPEATENPDDEITEEIPEEVIIENNEEEIVEEVDTLAYEFSASASVGSVLQTDTIRSEMSDLQRQTISSKLDAGILYQSVYNNIDIRYELNADTLKEYIILNQQPQSGTKICFDVIVDGISLVLQSDGSIYGIKEGENEPEYYLPAPYLFDLNGEISYDITVALKETDLGYEISYSLPHGWLAASERAYPVTIDPVVKPTLSTGNIRDKQVDENNDNVSHTSNYIEAGYHSTYGIERIYLKYRNLPEITSADVITNATIQIYRPYTSSSEAQMNVHKVLAEWESETLQWSNKPNYDTMIEDYAMVSSKGWYTWDITDIAIDWYEDKNTGMMFKLTDEIESAEVNNNKTFYSSDAGSSYRPVLYISYVNSSGLESYWDYHGQNAGRAGVGYINDYTGNLVWVHSGLGFSGNRMPVAISTIYNACDLSNDFGIGNGWRTNYNQLVYQLEGNTSYYVWEDEDGTQHYFKYVSSGTYEDESGIDLVLTTTGSGTGKYILTDKKGNKSYFDTKGRLTKIENNQATKSNISITYVDTSSNLISNITDGAGRVYEFVYTNDLLSAITYKGSGTTPIKTLTYSHVGNNLTGIGYPDNETVSFQYTENNLLNRATDIDGYNVRYQYATETDGTTNPEPNGAIDRVIKVTEYDGDTEAGFIEIEYKRNQTTFTDYLGNRTTSHFNDYGNTVSVQDNHGRAVYGQYAQDSDSSAKANQMVLSSKLQNTVKNYIKNHSFETSGYWLGNGSSGSISYSSDEAYIGNKSMKLANTGGLYNLTPVENYTLEAGKTYTFSAYVKTSGMSSGSGGFRLGIGTVGTTLTYGEYIGSNKDWDRYQVTYTAPGTSGTVEVMIVIEGSKTGTAYIDNVQLEQAATASRYNLVENGDFSFIGQANTEMLFWEKGGGCSTTEIRTQASESAAPQLDDNAYKVEGEVDHNKRIYQDIIVSGESGDTYTVAGWAKTDSAPLTDGTSRQVALMVRFYYTDDSTKEYIIDFNTDTSSLVKWQYVSGGVKATKAYEKIRILAIYDKNVNTTYFDGIQLFEEAFGEDYTYNSDGEVSSVTDLRGRKTRYQYNDFGDITEIFPANGTEIEIIYYDGTSNKYLTTSSEGVRTKYSYDTYGNTTKVRRYSTDNVDPALSGPAIETNVSYTSDGNMVSTTTNDLRKVTTYQYNTDTGLLEWTQTPMDTESTRTIYTYDTLYRPTSVTKNVSGLSGGLTAVSNSYTYEDDQIKTLTHSNTSSKSTTYTFGYGAFGLADYVKVGQNRELVSYEYKTSDKSYMLDLMEYGNGDSVRYEYDGQGRVTAVYYDGSTTPNVEYFYDNDGNLGSIKNNDTGITRKYIYDVVGQILKIVETGANYNHGVGYSFDINENVSEIVEVINDVNYTTGYVLDNDSRMTEMTQGSLKLNYTYDIYSRGETVTASWNGTAFALATYDYTMPTEKHESTQVSSIRNQIGANYDEAFAYSYDDNGRLTQVIYDAQFTDYTYDEIGQLKREDNQAAGKTWTYSYDAGGNIIEKKEYNYTTGELGTVLDTITYGYADADWADLLTSYDGQTITSDAIGNMLSDGTWTYTWEQGRQLKSMTNGTATLSFGYNEDGLRTSKTVGNTTWKYTYINGTLTHMTDGTNTLYFIGSAAVIYNGTTYYYVKNLQGDIVAIADTSGSVVVQYTYDAWGNILTTTGTMASTLGQINPLRYRGYYYDTETELYYLKTRYYSPKIGRFINADVYVNTGVGFSGSNTFTYCCNSPMMYIDSNGASCTTNDPDDTWRPAGETLLGPGPFAGNYSNVNCYAFALGLEEGEILNIDNAFLDYGNDDIYLSPGHIRGLEYKYKPETFLHEIEKDFQYLGMYYTRISKDRIDRYECKDDEWIIVVFVNEVGSFHFYRSVDDNIWMQKNGTLNITAVSDPKEYIFEGSRILEGSRVANKQEFAFAGAYVVSRTSLTLSESSYLSQVAGGLHV